MKKTLLYLIISVKTLSAYFIIALLFALVFSSCQTDEVAPMLYSNGRPIDDKVPVPAPGSIPPSEVIQAEYPGATQWQITFDNPNLAIASSYQRFFSTVDGSFQTLAELNSNLKTTNKVDMDFLFWRVQGPQKFVGDFTYPEHASATYFKPSDLSLAELTNIAAFHPERFQSIYENAPYEATSFQPFNYDKDGDESDYYKEGDSYLFLIDRNPVRYGAVYINEKHSFIAPSEPCTVTVLVQKD